MLKKQHGDDVMEYALIVKALLIIDKLTEVTLKRNFNIVYFVAKEKLAFTKMKPLCDLYKNGTESI